MFYARIGSAAAGAYSLALPVALPISVIAGATPSLTLVAIVKLLLKFRAGLKVTPASKALTSAMAPLALHTPVPGLEVEVTAPEVAVDRVRAAPLDRVRVAVMLAQSTS